MNPTIQKGHHQVNITVVLSNGIEHEHEESTWSLVGGVLIVVLDDDIRPYHYPLSSVVYWQAG